MCMFLKKRGGGGGAKALLSGKILVFLMAEMERYFGYRRLSYDILDIGVFLI